MNQELLVNSQKGMVDSHARYDHLVELVIELLVHSIIVVGVFDDGLEEVSAHDAGVSRVEPQELGEVVFEGDLLQFGMQFPLF